MTPDEQVTVLEQITDLPLDPLSIRWSLLFDNCFVHSAVMFRAEAVRAEFGGEFGVSAWLLGAWVANALRDAGVDARLTVSRAEAVSAADTPPLRLELAGPEIHVRLARQGWWN